ncbi:hypothetical protein Tco_0167525 [Tanacetum coccineum]
MAGSDNDSDDASVHSEPTIPQQQRNIQPQIITTVSNNNANADFHYKGAQGYMECSSKQAKPRDEDINLTLLRALPSSWSQDTPTFSSSQSAVQADSALLSTTSASKKMSYLDSPCYSSSTYTTPSNSKTGSHRSGNIIEDVLQSFVADTEPEQQLAYEDFDR